MFKKLNCHAQGTIDQCLKPQLRLNHSKQVYLQTLMDCATLSYAKATILPAEFKFCKLTLYIGHTLINTYVAYVLVGLQHDV